MKNPSGILCLMVVMTLTAFKIKWVAYLGYHLEHFFYCGIEVLHLRKHTGGIRILNLVEEVKINKNTCLKAETEEI